MNTNIRINVKHNTIQTFASRGAVRKFMNRLFPAASTHFIYAINDNDCRYFPIITACTHANEVKAQDNNVTVNTGIKTV